jgi:hypothetical protein
MWIRRRTWRELVADGVNEVLGVLYDLVSRTDHRRVGSLSLSSEGRWCLRWSGGDYLGLVIVDVVQGGLCPARSEARQPGGAGAVPRRLGRG